MSGVRIFSEYAERYDAWFEKHPFVYDAELRAVKKALPRRRENGVEIGVGTGRFASPLGIRFGVEPSERLRRMARSRGIEAMEGVGERLPFRDGMFDFALFVTTVCFLDDIEQAFREAYRVVKEGGTVIAGLVDKDSPLGKEYRGRKADSVFYREAVFFSAEEILALLHQAGFHDTRCYQTLFRPPGSITSREPVRKGRGRGSFLVIRAEK